MTEGLRPLRVGLIGAGTIARIAQLPVLASDPSVAIAGVVAGSRQETEAVLDRWPVEHSYPDLDAMLGDGDLDALFVLTPKQTHAGFVEAGIRAGVAVYCEKPLATSLTEGARLVELAEGSVAPVMVGLNRRFAPTYRRAHEVLEGPPLFAVAQKHRVGSEYRATLENAIHMIDLLRWFCGEAVEVHAAAAAGDPYREDGAAALLRFDTGATATLTAARCAGEWDERLELFARDTTVRVIAPDEVTIVRGGSASTETMRAAAAGWVDLAEAAGFAPAIRHFLDCVRTGDRPLTDAAEGLRSLELAFRVLESAGLPLEDDAAPA